jgi:hypothetical protein
MEIMKLDTKNKLKCITLFWSWWKARNKVNAEVKTWQTGHVESHVNRLALEYDEFFLHNGNQQAKSDQRWRPPDGDFLKTNTDGCYNQCAGSGGRGFVVRNSTGEAARVAAGRLDHVQDAFLSEAEACSRFLHVVQDWVYREFR